MDENVYWAKKDIKDNHDNTLISVHFQRWIYLPTCIWFTFPAVMFEMVQQASFLMLFLWLCVNRFRRQGRAWWFIIHWKREKKGSIKYLLKAKYSISNLTNMPYSLSDQHPTGISRKYAIWNFIFSPVLI